MHNKGCCSFDFKKMSEKFMINSIRTVDNDVYRLRSEINTLRERIIVSEVQLNY